MSRFQSTVSTIAALSTITVTAVTAYNLFGTMKQNSLQQQMVIEDLKHQLAQKQTQPITPPVQVVSQPVTPPLPVVPPAAAPLPPQQ